MCLLINQTNNTPIKKEYLENADISNPDGMGFAYANGGKIHIEKFREFEPFYISYVKAVKKFGNVSNFIVHFRYSTHGVNNGIFNVHPFRINERLAFAHNGILDVKNHNKKSDTRVFNDTILRKLKSNFLNSNAVCSLIEGFIGSDKLVFLNAKGKTKVLNEEMGHWDGGVWYSNTSYKKVNKIGCYSSSYGSYMGTAFTPSTARYEMPKTNIITRSTCNGCGEWKQVNPVEFAGQNVNVCKACKPYYE